MFARMLEYVLCMALSQLRALVRISSLPDVTAQLYVFQCNGACVLVCDVCSRPLVRLAAHTRYTRVCVHACVRMHSRKLLLLFIACFHFHVFWLGVQHYIAMMLGGQRLLPYVAAASHRAARRMHARLAAIACISIWA